MTRARALATLLPLALAGCGFRPVYMASPGGAAGPAARNLARIHVALIPDRPGQLLRQALQQRFHGADDTTPRRYTLHVSYWITGQNEGILPSSVATRVQLIAGATWTLTRHDPAHSLVTSGSAQAMDGVDQFDEQYFASQLDNNAADRHLADAIAGQIATRLAIFFRQRADQAAR
ncbi:MAG: LPS assembly lipoprotein LptE [Acetobacteraceae bacterium]